MKQGLFLICLVVSGLLFACEHNNITKKCVKCLRENYMSYGGEKAVMTCAEAICSATEHMGIKHKHCGKHGSIITLTRECKNCAEEEAKAHWQEAQLAKEEGQEYKKLGIKIPEYRQQINVAQKMKMIQMIQEKINQIDKRIEVIENKILEPDVSESSVKWCETKIEELEYQKTIYFRAYEVWENAEIY